MYRRIRTVAAVALLAAPSVFAASRIEVVPSTFDFGWTPANAKVTAGFVLKNTGEDTVPITAVVPTCGCTAAEFSPASVGSQEESKISLTFNTRGYENTVFHKPARIATDKPDAGYVATLTGHVTDADALLLPEGNGTAGFEESSTSRTKKISVVNKTGKEVTLKIVQPAAEWATVELPKGAIKNGEKGEVEISVAGSLKDERHTSVTLASADTVDGSRVTLAIFTGPGPAPYRMNPVPTPVAKPAPKASPKSPAKAAKKK